MTGTMVIDASAVVEVLMRSAEGLAVQRACGTNDLAAPECLDPEVVHALRGLERGGHFPTARLDSAVGDLRDSSITRVPHRTLIDDAWRLRHNLSAYDSMYVALARQLDCPLVTLDTGIVGAPNLGVTLIKPSA